MILSQLLTPSGSRSDLFPLICLLYLPLPLSRSRFILTDLADNVQMPCADNSIQGDSVDEINWSDTEKPWCPVLIIHRDSDEEERQLLERATAGHSLASGSFSSRSSSTRNKDSAITWILDRPDEELARSTPALNLFLTRCPPDLRRGPTLRAVPSRARRGRRRRTGARRREVAAGIPGWRSK